MAAGSAIAQYSGWNKASQPEPEHLQNKRKSFAAALQAGVIISKGGDVGVFAHGDNAREMELITDYGMKTLDVLRTATSVNADVFGLSNSVGRLKSGLMADIIAVEGNPVTSISQIRKVILVMKDGIIYKQ